MTDPSRDESTWARAEALFDELVDRPLAEQRVRLSVVARADPELARTVRDLLNADARTDDRIADIVQGAADAVVADRTPSDVDVRTSVRLAAGERIGPWRLEHELGRGGMGAVWLAERDDGTYRARVAIKLLLGPIVVPALVRRFEYERQLLADLEHPDIARLVDGGTTDDGIPYFAMEFVDGIPLDAWCREHDADVTTRVTLVRRIARAVQHAHEALVVHRDIKPSNILVDANGAPKLLDFGIATILAAPAETPRDPTLYQALTPSYASPEQLRGERVTTAADTWALGVVLYRLLADVLPFDIVADSPAERAALIAKSPPVPPSRRATAAHARSIRGDLDTIVLKALRVDPAERYRNAADFADDLDRWLERRPIAARPATLGYRLRRAARRHPVATVASGAALLAIAATTFISIAQARRAERERDLAEQRRVTAEASTRFVVELFNLLDPSATGGDAISARELLDVGAETVRDGVSLDADLRASLAMSFGTVYRNLASYDAATSLLDTAIAVRERANGPTSEGYARALQERAVLAHDVGRVDSAIVLHRRALAVARAQPEPDSTLLEAIVSSLGVSLSEQGELAAADTVLRDGLLLARAVYAPDDPQLGWALVALADLRRDQGRFDDAVPLLEEAVALIPDSARATSLDAAQALNHLARTHVLAGRPAEAEPLVREAVAILERVHVEPHPETAAALGNLSGILADLDRLDDALEARLRSLALLDAVFPDGHPYVAGTLSSLADLRVRRGESELAGRRFAEALAMMRRDLPAGDVRLGFPLTGLGRLHLAAGRADLGVPLLREAVSVRGGLGPDAQWRAAVSATALAEGLAALGRSDEARTVADSAHRVLLARFGADDPRTRAAADAAR